MGIFSSKNKFDITPKEKALTNIVSTHMIGGTIKINAKLVVPEGYVAVIGKRGRVADKFESGEHYFNFANLPLMCRRYKIDKIENGKQKDSFKADLYFLNMGLYGGTFKTYRKAEMGTKAYGLFKAHAIGVYSYKINDVKEFMQSLLNEYDYIKTGEAENIVENWVNEIIVDELEKQNFIITDVISNNPIIANALKLRISKLFSTAGLELEELKITKFKLPKKYQIESDKNIDESKSGIINEEVTEDITSENIDDSSINKKTTENKDASQLSELISSKDETYKQKYYELESMDADINDASSLLSQFGIGESKIKNNTNEETPKDEHTSEEVNTKLEELESSNTDSQNFVIQQDQMVEDTNKPTGTSSYVPFGNLVIEEIQLEEIQSKLEDKSKEKTFVDLSLNELYTSETETKRCLTCGAANNIKANHCLLCGEKFSQTDI